MAQRKTLLLMRHAKAARDVAKWQDFDRPLNERGMADAARMGQWLVAHKLTPDWICASASVRTRQTAELVAQEIDFAADVTLRKDLYHAAADRYLAEIRQMSVAVNCLLLIGHNPGLEQLVQNLSGQFVALPTAAIARFTLHAMSWDAVDDHDLELHEITTPKML